MRISEIIKKGMMVTECGAICRYSCVNIGFLPVLSESRDETQLNVSRSLLTKEGVKELEELFSSLSGELLTRPDRVTDVTVVASAATEDELVMLGY